MPHRRVHRLTTAFVVALSLLFSQLALAAYVCPGQADTVAMAQMMAAAQSCDGMDPQQPALCHQHVADAGKTFEAAKLPAVSLPAVIQVLALPLVLDDVEAGGATPAAPHELRPPPDPIFLSTLRLRV